MTRTIMDANETKFQKLRLQRFYLAQISYLITYVIIALCWFAGQYSASAVVAASHVALALTLQLGFFILLKSGYNLRFKDPSLTSAQLIVATLLASYLLMFAGEIRGSLIMIYPLSLLFGVFHLKLRQFIYHAGFALACFSLLLIWDMTVDYSQKTPTVHLLEWFVLASFLSWLCVFGDYIRRLRERLQMRHSTLQLHQETLKGMMGQLQSLASTDGLTGLANRRHFLDEAARRMELLRPGKALGIALMDLDHFKRVNDLYGHAAGDEVLRRFAQLVTENLREEDLVARFGGEEFILLLDKTDIDTLQQCVERIRTAFASMDFDMLAGTNRFTFSAGMALVRAGDNLEARILQADQALYMAKELGRNRCEVHRSANA
jgi:diguanylate cyclase